ncbi:MAG: AsmA family protein, partial [Cytophagales bacterium]
MKFRPKKILKWTGYTFLGLFLFLIALTWIIPFFFSDTIKSLIDKELQKQVNADVHFKANDFSLSFLRSFPNLSVGQENLSITGKGEFQGDTLMAFQSFRASVNVWSFLWGSEPQVTGIYLKKPRIFVKVKANGKANYDIMIPQIDTIKKEEKPTEFQIGIRWWEIQDGYLVYDDKAQKIYTKIDKLNHRGSGNFNQKVFDLTTFTSLDRLNVVTNGASMVENRLFEFDVTMNINNDEKKYTFKKNSIKINDFVFGFDGYVQLLKDSTTKLDVSYKAQENKFKNILSLVPAI